MKKIVITGILGLFVFAISSCGNRHICYINSADMSKDKVEQNQKVELIQKLSEKMK